MHDYTSYIPLLVIGVVTVVVGVITGGQGRLSAVTVPWDDLGPTKSPLSVPPAMIVYVTPHSSPLSVTVAVPLVIGVLSVHTNVWISTCTYDTIRFNYITTYVHKFYNFYTCKNVHKGHHC